MPARRPTRTLLGVAAGLTATALLGSGLALPAVAGPTERSSDLVARKLGGGATALPDKWLVQVSGKPALRGGSRASVTANQTGVRTAAARAGVRYSLLHSYTRVWNGFSVKAGKDQVEKLRRMPGVTAVYPVYTVKLPDRVSRPQLKYSLPMIGAPEAQVAGYRGDGIRVGVIDSGIDYNHPDLGGSGTRGNNADFKKPGGRVMYGYDFVGDAYDADVAGSQPRPDDFPDDCDGHGTHVAGTIGANGDIANGGARGVAPNVTFGAYRIFGCAGSADTEVILAAMDMAAADDMDVVNMSLGSEFDSWPDYPEAQAASALRAAGTIVVASAGNEGSDGLFTAGNLSVGKDVISVASVENTGTTNWYFTVNPVPQDLRSAVTFLPGVGAANPPKSGSFPLVRASAQNGCSPLEDLTGKIALIIRGDCYFSTKAANAESAHAAGVVIYNNDDDSVLNLTLSGVEVGIPVVGISEAEGSALWDQLGTTATTLSWAAQPLEEPNPVASVVSDFSSFGMAADLTLTPDVAAPGGNIWSTYPLEQNGYANLSGTSMAAPHVTGAVALLLQAGDRAHRNLRGNVSEIRSALQNTATPIDTLNYFGELWDGYYEPAIRQGAGLIHIDRAIAAETGATTVSPGRISLGENRTGYRRTTLKLTNRGTKSETFRLSVQNAVNAVPSPTNYWYLYDVRNVSAKFSSRSVTVKAGRTATVSVWLKQPTRLPLGSLYSGWVQLTKSDRSRTLVVPFAGFQGDYQKVKVLQDYYDYDEDAGDVVATTRLPALATYDGRDENTGEDLFTPLPSRTEKHVFTLNDDTTTPWLLFHFEYPVSKAYFNVYKATPAGRKGAEVFTGHRTFLELGKWGRDNGYLSLPFDGKIPFSSTTAAGLTVPDGDYVLEIRVLKALGNARKSSDWESYVSPAFTIHRATKG